RKF
ncbi:hypothetical protein SCAR479_10733, partial [Seiridium cardinale]